MARRAPHSGVVWQVVAPWVRWPLASPRRLGGVLLGAVAVIIALSMVNGHGQSGSASPARGVSAVDEIASAPSGTTPTAGLTTSAGLTQATQQATGTDAGVDSVPAGLSKPDAAANQFVVLWARPDEPQPSWSQALKPLATDGFARQLSTVLPLNVPARKVTGTHAPVVNGGSASVLVNTDIGTVRVDLVRATAGWRVDSIAPDHVTSRGDAGSSIAPTYTPIPTQ